jgi:hypothetical protein
MGPRNEFHGGEKGRKMRKRNEMEKMNGCSPACSYWAPYIGYLDEPVCGKYETICSAAMVKCEFLNHLNRKPECPRKPKLLQKPERPRENTVLIKTTNIWPGGRRGWGPVTRTIEGE